ncbi:hypothetical protein PFISCL1PPCAC_24437 [Pristionchus fissidentatus]|uniref:E3 SUMO-protein ligase NSE2 n=1 Tax=Pristionchus fissidentatus TaxID=1538716 RepID=A0AAV5WNC8_9BILA|nr:hypothetical protein PFISCL1PPCAC_24437 [Pristionchus fissidentatus]
MDLSLRNLKEVQNQLRRVLESLNDLPVTDSNQAELLRTLKQIEDEDNEMSKLKNAFEQLEESGEKEDSPDAVLKKIAEIMEESDVVGAFEDEINRIREKMEEGEEDEEEMEVVSATYSKKDPITKEDIKEPVKNRICGHVYDKDSVKEFIQMNKANRMAIYQCPVQGCGNKNNLSMDDLAPFPKFFELCK